MNVWKIEEDSFDPKPKKLHSNETVFTIGNGYFGTRGTFEEGLFGAMPATLLFGVFDHIDIGKEELANAPDWLLISLFVNGERFRLSDGKILAYHRSLDMRSGVVTRTVRWESPGGIRLRISSERFASLSDEHVGAIRYNVTAEEHSSPPESFDVLLRATINPAVGNGNDRLMHWETVDVGNVGNLAWLQSETRHSGVRLVQMMSFTTSSQQFTQELIDSDIAPAIELRGQLAAGETLTAEKIVVMYTSRDVEDPYQVAVNHHNILASASTSSADLPGGLYEALLTKNEEAWQDYWNRSDILIEGDDKSQQAIRYNIYQLRISASSHDSRYSIAAKGLTGFGYRGHIFHDTEIFMLPFFTYTHPDIARNLLLYRYHLLPAARDKAKQNGYEGAQFPWESTLDGIEATPESIIHPESGELISVPNGKIELHITASVCYAFMQYWYVTGDDLFMRDFGAELILSTATFWASRAEWNAERKDYEINKVIGPDEWHENVNNNAYTNYMARWNIEKAIDILQWLHRTAPSKAEELIDNLNLTQQRLNHWHDVVDHMRIPQDKNNGLFEQFDDFFSLEHLTQTDYKGRKQSYQAVLGMDPVQKYQIVKQADVLMLVTLLRNQFDFKTKEINWDYYYPITDHDFGSSLTPAFHVILACELGLLDTAYTMFCKGALVDLENLRNNTPDGIHDACCGAVWQAIIFGFAGLKVTNEGYTTSPTLPDGWTRLAFNFSHKGEPTFVDLRKE